MTKDRLAIDDKDFIIKISLGNKQKHEIKKNKLEKDLSEYFFESMN